MAHPLTALVARRAALAGAAALAGTALLGSARALGRTPIGGKLAFAVPWPVSGVDPHDPFDAAAALFAHALFDSLFALDASGEPYPTLAAEAPRLEGAKTTVRLREGLISAKGQRLDARDVAFSLQRARRVGATAWWGDLPTPALVARDPLALAFATTDGLRLARTLSSPLFALVPRSFDPASPDGTGALAAEATGPRLVLRRNAAAARGASFLDEIAIDQALDLSASLRSFESNQADLAWLGSGLHAPRPGAQAFDWGSVAWIVLQTGADAGPWGAPGTAQRLIDDLAPERLQHFGLGALPPAAGNAAWGGKPCDLVVQEGSAYLEELARALSSLLSRPGHEITPKPVPSAELAQRRKSGNYALLLGVARPFAGPGLSTLVTLASASDPVAALELLRRPPRFTSFSPRILARTLKLGVLGELRVVGAHAPEIHLARAAGGEGWDLANTYRAAPGPG